MIKDETINRLIKFRDERDWKQFHSGENLAKSILIEAGEYAKEEKSIDKVKEELADVLMYSILLSDAYHLDLDEIINEKLIINENKYPASLVKGSSKKYDEYKEKSRKK